MVVLLLVFLLLLSGSFMRAIRTGSLNVNGGTDGQKRALISVVTTLNGTDVLFCQETLNLPEDLQWGKVGMKFLRGVPWF